MSFASVASSVLSSLLGDYVEGTSPPLVLLTACRTGPKELGDFCDGWQSHHEELKAQVISVRQVGTTSYCERGQVVQQPQLTFSRLFRLSRHWNSLDWPQKPFSCNQNHWCVPVSAPCRNLCTLLTLLVSLTPLGLDTRRDWGEVVQHQVETVVIGSSDGTWPATRRRQRTNTGWYIFHFLLPLC